MAPLLKPYAPQTPAAILAADGRRLPVPETMTLAEFRAFPWPDESRWELIQGVPVMAPSPFGGHQQLLAALTALLHTHLLGLLVHVEYDVQLPGMDAYFRPDLVALRDDADYDPAAVPYEGVPALVVEILSPSSAANDFGVKRDAYARAGVPEYWVVDPKTGALTLHVQSAAGASFNDVAGDSEGFIVSPALGQGIRIRPTGNTYRIDTRPA